MSWNTTRCAGRRLPFIIERLESRLLLTGTTVTYTIEPTLSTVTVNTAASSILGGAATVTPQSTGSLSDTMSGTLTGSLVGNTLTFSSGSNIALEPNGSFLPGPSTADDNFGASVAVPVLGNVGNVAVRGAAVDIISGSATFGGSVSGLQLEATAGSVDYLLETKSGTISATGQSVFDASGQNLTGSVSSNVQTITLPYVFTLTYADSVTGGNDTLVLDGTVVAQATLVAPTITTPPTSTSVAAGTTATFTAAASGTPAPTVQWQVSTSGGPFTNIPGATSPTLSFTAAAGENGNEYQAVFSNADGSKTTTPVTLTVTSASAPQIAVTGNSQSITDGASTTSASNDTAFGSTTLGGSSLSETYTITNNGTGTLTVGSVSIVGANPGDFSVTSQPAASVAAGSSTTFTVQFSPTASGTRNATLSFTENDSTTTSPFTFAISGIATSATPPLISVTGGGQAISDGETIPSDTNDTAFGSTPLGGSSLSETYTITNNGSGPLTVGSVSIVGANPGDFSVTSQPAASVAASGGTTTFTVQFSPTAFNTRNATVSFAENDTTTTSPFTFAISGVATGAGPNLSVLGNGVPITDGATTTSAANDTAFGSTTLGGSALTETFEIAYPASSGDTVNLALGSVSIVGANRGDFTVTSQPAASVVPGETTFFTVQFSPTAAGTRNATLSFTENDSTTSSPFTFAISGVATSTGTATTVTTVSSSANPAVYAQPVTFTATVSSASGVPTGTVDFMDGSNLLGTGTLGLVGTLDKAMFKTLSPLSPGGHSITAVYQGDTNFAGSPSNALSELVIPASTVISISASVNPVIQGHSETFTATISSVSGIPTGTINFDINGITGSLGTRTLSMVGGRDVVTVTINNLNLPVGTYSIAAGYLGNSDFAVSLSHTFNLVVHPGTTAPAIATTISPAVSGQSVPSAAMVSALNPATGAGNGEASTKTTNTTAIPAVVATSRPVSQPAPKTTTVVDQVFGLSLSDQWRL